MRKEEGGGRGEGWKKLKYRGRGGGGRGGGRRGGWRGGRRGGWRGGGGEGSGGHQKTHCKIYSPARFRSFICMSSKLQIRFQNIYLPHFLHQKKKKQI